MSTFDLPSPDRRRRNDPALGASLAKLVERTPGARLYVRPPFDRLPAVPGQPPPGVTATPEAVHLHLAVSSVELRAFAAELGAAVAAVTAEHGVPDAEIHIHFDQLEGDPFGA